MELRNAAVKVVEAHWPDSLYFLEIGRACAQAGSSLGNLSARWSIHPQGLAISYVMDMRDANDPEVLQAMNIVNHAVIAKNAEKGWDAVPDLTSRFFVLKFDSDLREG
jgi:hypothetical protein